MINLKTGHSAMLWEATRSGGIWEGFLEEVMFQLNPEGRVASHPKQLFIIYLKSKF